MKKIPWLHIILFVVTVFTTLVAGAYYSDDELQKNFFRILREPWKIKEGISFSFTIIIVLLSHELAHYFASRKHNIEATLPYFIPAPTIIGTFGAVIKTKSPILTRKALLDIGASGPIIGFVISAIAYTIGLKYSEIIAITKETITTDIALGPSLLSYGLIFAVHGALPTGYTIALHPIAFAGWVGLLVTSLNLIPVGQLDGGHIAYALLGDKQIYVSKIIIPLLLILGLLFWPGWILWAMLLIILGLRHPPVMHWEAPLDLRRKFIGLLAVIIFIITFSPAPFIFIR